MEKIKEPTKEQIAAFWEWCGQYKSCGYCDGTGRIYSNPDVYSQCGSCNGIGSFHPELDLNNLFKYAIPPITKEYRNWKSILHDWIESLTGNYEKDTLLLFAQLYAIIKEK